MLVCQILVIYKILYKQFQEINDVEDKHTSLYPRDVDREGQRRIGISCIFWACTYFAAPK